MITAPGWKSGIVGPEGRRRFILTLLWKKRIPSLNVAEEFVEGTLMLDNLRKSTENGPWLKVPVKLLVIRPIVSVDGW